MAKTLKILIILIVITLFGGLPSLSSAGSGVGVITEPGNLTPENTVLLSSEMDARFSQDFSVLLKHLRLEWVILENATVPDSVKDKNLVILGHPDAKDSGEVIRGMLTAEEIEGLWAATDHHVVLEKKSPWTENRSVIICYGADRLLMRNAAEEAIRALISSAPPTSEWLRTNYEAELDESVREYVTQLQFEWEDEELPFQNLAMDVGAKPRKSITAQQAAEDVERLFYLFSHGYSGYAFFNHQGAFKQAEMDILDELSSQSSWSTDAFSSLLHEHLDFIVDCHLRIGDYRYGGHRDFWYDTQSELRLGKDGYEFVSDSSTYKVISINDADPASFILPSLNQEGEPVYRLGLLSTEKPLPLILVATSGEAQQQFEIELQRSDFEYYSKDIFREDMIGGIPVVRVRTFGDYYLDELNQFVKTASNHRGEPVVILDIRGNGGGNERWPINWIQRLTGRRAEAVFVSTELESKTSMMGRANAFNYWYTEQDTAFYSAEVERMNTIVETFESGARQPGWTGPYYPQLPLILNDTTVIVVTNDLVASAGEGFVLRISQLENVIVVGENSMGALTFGNISAHQLPHSRLMIWMPINFGLFLDQEFREEVGLVPDLWVPAADAVNFSVAALRRGTITTSQPLPESILQQDFMPENPNAKSLQKTILYLLVVTGFVAGGLAWAFFMRKKPRVVAGVAVIWIAVGSVYTVRQGQPVGFGLLLMGIVCLVWGGIRLLKARTAPLEMDS
jgi:hypothetical protein